MNTPPLVSIVVVAYRDFSGWKRTLHSILMQDYPAMELIVQDDGSPGFSAVQSEMEAYIARHKQANLLSFQVLGLPENLGTVKNLNLALMKARGVYFKAFGLGDGFRCPDAVRRYVAAAEESGAELVFARALAFDTAGKPVAVIPSLARQAYMGRLTPKELFLLTLSYTSISSPSAFIRRSAYLAEGGFDQRFTIVEDYNFWLRCFLHNRATLFMEDVLAVYEVSGSLIGCDPILSEARIRERKLAFDLYNRPYDHRYGMFQGLYNRLYLALHYGSALRARSAAGRGGLPAKWCRLEQGLYKGILRVFFPPVPGKPRLPRETLREKAERTEFDLQE